MSNVIKPFAYASSAVRRRIEGWQPVQPESEVLTPAEKRDVQIPEEVQTAETEAEAILQSASRMAEEMATQARREREALLAAAQQSLDERRAELERECARITEERSLQGYENGYDEGFQLGKSEGEKTGQQVWAEQIATLNEALQQMEEWRSNQLQSLEEEVLYLSCAIAAKILGREVEQHAQAIVQIVQEALLQTATYGSVQIIAHPKCLPRLLAARQELQQLIDENGSLRFAADAGLPETGCIIKSSEGSIDCTVDVQLSEIRKALLMRFAERSGHDITAALR